MLGPGIPKNLCVLGVFFFRAKFPILLWDGRSLTPLLSLLILISQILKKSRRILWICHGAASFSAQNRIPWESQREICGIPPSPDTLRLGWSRFLGITIPSSSVPPHLE